jgi:hypothetical protein
MVKAILFFLITSVAIASEHGAKEPTHEVKEEHQTAADSHEEIAKDMVADIAKDIKIPLKMWEMLSDKKEVDHNDVYSFSEVKVILKEKNADIIKKGAIKIEYPRGGGELNLANYVTGKQGTFFVDFDFPEFEEATYKKIIFISNSRKRKIDDHIYGSGCHELIDISNRFFKESKNGGIKVNTTRNRHVSVLAGSFILIAKKNKQNYLSQVTFTDTEHKNLLCQEN